MIHCSHCSGMHVLHPDLLGGCTYTPWCFHVTVSNNVVIRSPGQFVSCNRWFFTLILLLSW